MDVASALRKIKRQFGDEYNVIVLDVDIYDWIHDAELDIIRATSDNDLSLQVAANLFPVEVPDRVQIKRVSINGKALTYTTLNELDINHANVGVAGMPTYWYFQSGRVGLWPATGTNDTFNVDVLYIKVPQLMTEAGPNEFTVPEVFHEDVVKYCLAQAHDKNQNFRAAEAMMEQYDRRVSVRRHEAQSADTILYKTVDPSDYDMEGSY